MIRSARLTDLRLALILLDNAAELLIYETLKPVFETDDYFQHVRQTMSLLNMPVHEAFAPPYTADERRAAEREFEPMLRIIEHRLNLITSGERSILRITHKLRRDAFHRGQLRDEILRPLCVLLYHTVLDLAAKLPRAKGYGNLRPRKLEKSEVPHSPDFEPAADLTFDHQNLCETLANDVVQRIDKLLGELSGFFPHDLLIDEYLFRMQFGNTLPTQVPALTEDELDVGFREWKKTSKPAITVAHVRSLRKMGERIRTARQSSNGLIQYWSIDERLSKIESTVTKDLEQLDRHIQRQIDISRGK